MSDITLASPLLSRPALFGQRMLNVRHLSDAESDTIVGVCLAGECKRLHDEISFGEMRIDQDMRAGVRA